MRQFLLAVIMLIIVLSSCRRSLATDDMFTKSTPGAVLKNGFRVPQHALNVMQLSDDAVGVYFDISPEFASEYLSQVLHLRTAEDLPPALLTLGKDEFIDKFKNPKIILVKDAPEEETYEALVVSDNTGKTGTFAVFYTHWEN